MVEAVKVTLSVDLVFIVVDPVSGDVSVRMVLVVSTVVAASVEDDDKTTVRQHCNRMTQTKITFFQCIVAKCTVSNEKNVITFNFFY